MMFLENCDIWSLANCGAIGIPTNGYLNRNGKGVMGAGLALEARKRYSRIETDLGALIQREGHVVGWLRKTPDQLISIPVKPSSILVKTNEHKAKILPKFRNIYDIGQSIPGFHCLADIGLIEESLNQLVNFIEKNSLKTVFIPLLGCGNGGLSPSKDLFPLLEKMNLPDSIVLVIQSQAKS